VLGVLVKATAVMLAMMVTTTTLFSKAACLLRVL
jgi:hypothetical protein